MKNPEEDRAIFFADTARAAERLRARLFRSLTARERDVLRKRFAGDADAIAALDAAEREDGAPGAPALVWTWSCPCGAQLRCAAESQAGAQLAALESGWKRWATMPEGFLVCPSCPAGRPPAGR